MTAAKYLAPVLLMIAVIVFGLNSYSPLSNWWFSRIQLYATWVVDEFESM